MTIFRYVFIFNPDYLSQAAKLFVSNADTSIDHGEYLLYALIRASSIYGRRRWHINLFRMKHVQKIYWPVRIPTVIEYIRTLCDARIVIF